MRLTRHVVNDYVNAMPDTPDVIGVKKQLAAVLGELKAQRANPYNGTMLASLTDEIREMRKAFNLSYREIATKLTALGVTCTEEEIGAFCRFMFKSRGGRGSARKPAPSRGGDA